MSTKQEIIEAPCGSCGRSTDHAVLKSQSKDFHDEESDAWWEMEHRMIECMGCHTISLEKSVISSEFPGAEITHFPPPISRRKPSWFDKLATKVPSEMDLPGLLDEVYSALHADNRRLATMGTRAVLDMVIVHTVGDVGGFAAKVRALVEKGFISERQRGILEAALDAGHAAAHRGHAPTGKQLDQVMDIVENVLQQIFVLPELAKELKKATPTRKRLKK